MNVPTELAHRLKLHGQEHVLAGWDGLEAARQTALITQLAGIDFSELEQLYGLSEAASQLPELAGHLEPLPVEEPGAITAEDVAAGEAALREGAVAVLLVAGGQGSRLNFEHPKGMYPVGPVSDRTLFDVHAAKVAALSRRYGRPVPFLVMTSPATHAETEAYFANPDRFGLEPGQVTFFCQGTMPALDIVTGRLLMSGPGEIFSSPNGHGGTLTALADSGLLAKIRGRGVKHVFYFQVDNPLVKIADPGFVGMHLRRGSEVSTKVIDKAFPAEKMGVFARIDGRCGIIEYTDLPDELARLQDDRGRLIYRAGNPAIHVFDVNFLGRVTEGTARLPFHVARKVVPCLDESGRRVVPELPNAYKFEMFIFDAFPIADRWLALQTTREEEFAPVKNADGNDSPATSKRMMSRQAASWLRAAGMDVPEGTAVEIDPRFALDADELKAKLPPGFRVEGPTLIR